MPYAEIDARQLRVAAVAACAVGAALVGWLLVAVYGRRAVRQIGVQGLSIIGVLSGLHIAVSYASRISGFALSSLLGPYAVYVIGLTSEGLTSLLFAVAVVLVPRPGTFAISSLTVFAANALFTGQLGVVDVLFVSVSMMTAEACLAVMGVTMGRGADSKLQMANRNLQIGEEVITSSIARVNWSLVTRVALAIGVANMATLYAQFCLAQVMYRLVFPDWFVATLSLVTGLLYGSIGAGLGVLVGGRLCRVAL